MNGLAFFIICLSVFSFIMALEAVTMVRQSYEYTVKDILLT